jgi:hypothetical protein
LKPNCSNQASSTQSLGTTNKSSNIAASRLKNAARLELEEAVAAMGRD